MHCQRILKLWVCALCLAAGFAPSRAQSSTMDLQIPVVDRLPVWYFEQKANQAVGVSFAGMGTDAAYHQAVLMARVRVALQQVSLDAVKGKIQSASVSGKKTESDSEDRSYRCEVSASLQLPTDYMVLDQCRLKNGTVMVLLADGNNTRDIQEKLNLVFASEIRNDTVEWYVKMTLPDKYALELERTDTSFFVAEVYIDGRGTHLYDQHLLYDCKHYYNASFHQNLLIYPDEKTEKYLGWLNIEGLLTDLCRKLLAREFEKSDTR